MFRKEEEEARGEGDEMNAKNGNAADGKKEGGEEGEEGEERAKLPP